MSTPLLTCTPEGPNPVTGCPKSTSSVTFTSGLSPGRPASARERAGRGRPASAARGMERAKAMEQGGPLVVNQSGAQRGSPLPSHAWEPPDGVESLADRYCILLWSVRDRSELKNSRPSKHLYILAHGLPRFFVWILYQRCVVFLTSPVSCLNPSLTPERFSPCDEPTKHSQLSTSQINQCEALLLAGPHTHASFPLY